MLSLFLILFVTDFEIRVCFILYGLSSISLKSLNGSEEDECS